MIIAQRLFAKKTEKKHLTNVSLIIFTLILFFNPLSLNIFVKLQTSNFSFDISLIN
jgi:hypothetical protein